MSNFLNKIGSYAEDFRVSLNEQLSAGENTSRSLDSVDPNDPNRTVKYGSLGNFSKKIDQSAQRSYVESGYIRNVKPRNFEVLMQQPDITVLVKKNIFSSLSDNFKVELMDSSERGFYKAAKRLFQNKTQVISIYEKLSKVEKAITNRGALDDFFVPLLVSGVQALESVGLNIVDTKTKDTLGEIRKLQAFSEPLDFTTWLVDPSTPYDFGEGTGVIEITGVSQLNTTCAVQLSQQASLTIEDPYHLLNISSQDIDKAIADIYNPVKNSQLFQFSENALADRNNDLISQLNTARNKRGVPGITIKTSPNSKIYKRVSVFVDLVGKEIIFNYDAGLLGIGGEVSFDKSSSDTDISSINLTQSEQELLADIIRNTYQILNLRRDRERQLDLNSIDESTDEGARLKKEIRYVREKMRLHFMNKNIIQSMDSVHIYISSKTMVDSKIIGYDQSTASGSSSNILTKLNTSINYLEQSFNNISGFFGQASNSSFVEIEKASIVGADFPTWLWVMMRNDFTRQGAGTHVFAGIVKNVSENFKGNSYSLTVNIADNTEYFSMGLINKKPGIQPLEREVYDPYTPFDLEYDFSGFYRGESPKLLPENEKRLNSGLIKFKNGSKFLGSPVSSGLYLVGDDRKKVSINNNIQKVYYDPDGLIYRWKSGIGTFTFNGPKYFNPLDSGVIDNGLSTPSITQNIYAGQDVMNVLSLLICGIPYNYNTFVKNAIDRGNLSFTEKANNTNLTNVDVAVSFYRSFLADLQKNNLTWGNFLPFKKLIISEKGLQFLISGQFSLQSKSAKLSKLLENRAKAYDALTLAASSLADNPRPYTVGPDGTYQAPSEVDGADPVINISIQTIKEIDDNIDSINKSIEESISQPNLNDGQIKIFGNDISFDPNYSEKSEFDSPEKYQKEGLELRRKLKHLTQRRLWKVKSNTDSNLLIIDDSYDKDYDIQAFELALNGQMELFRSEYATVKDQISAVSSILGLEVFADTQGHINVKPPGYNKVPSSVFARMISDGERVYPKALESLFLSQADSLINSIEIIEDEIRLRTVVLGYETDEKRKKFLSSDKTSDGKFHNDFAFLTSEDTGSFSSGKDTTKTMTNSANPESREDLLKGPLKPVISTVSDQLRKTALFDYKSQVNNLYSTTESSKIEKSIYDKIKRRLKMKKGMNVPELNQFIQTRENKVLTQSFTLKIIKEIANFVNERQGLIKLLYNSIKNIDDASIINNPDSNGNRAALFPSLYKKEEIPSILEHMIEDENEDDLGVGSGGRYIIKDNQIISMSINEAPPAFTAVEVNGSVSQGLTNESGFNVGSSQGFSGNYLVSALSVDYDMWRMYGFKLGNAVTASYLKNSESQAAPLAVWQLNNERKKIISGSLTIVGNEYMQPGEVIYIESRDLLFYVESVSHSFTYGSQFQTTLNLSYGHNPGEYLPTMLDIVGKALYSKSYSANLVRNVREGNGFGYEHLGTLVVEGFNYFTLDNDSEYSLNRLISGKLGDKNRNVLNTMLLSLKSSQVQDVEPEITLRIYTDKEKNQPSQTVTDELIKVCEAVKSWLSNPTKKNLYPNDQNQGSVIESIPQTGSESINLGYDINKVVVIKQVDSSDKESPSNEAWLYAENVLNNNPGLNVYNPSGRSELIASKQISDQLASGQSKEAVLGAEAGRAAAASQQATSRSVGNENKKTQQDDINTYDATSYGALFSNIIDIWIKFKPKQVTPETSTRNNLGDSQAGNQNTQAVAESQQAYAGTRTSTGQS